MRTGRGKPGHRWQTGNARMLTADERWALEQAATEVGFVPHTKAGGEFALSLEARGLLLRSNRHGELFLITDAGREALARKST